MTPRSTCLLLCAALAAGCTEGEPGSVFIALQSDFASFESWPKFFLGDGPLDGHPTGGRHGFINKPAPKGSTTYPVGSILVKTVEFGTSKLEWEMFAMAKRGGEYNLGGAKDWEFFTLKFSTGGVPVIVTRGTNPADLESDGGAPGHGYADTAGTGITCNRCHGLAGTERQDHIIASVLAPGNQ